MIEWHISTTPVPYLDALTIMEERVQAIQEQVKPEMVWLLEHPSLFTVGGGVFNRNDVLDDGGLPIYPTGRGGKVTYHGPGQRIAYVMLNLKRRQPDVRAYVKQLEEWLIQTLAYFGIKAERRQGRVGLWVKTDDTEKKIAAIGVRLQKWVSFHGIALNVSPDLSYFTKIIPCGIQEYGVTSMAELGIKPTLAEVDQALKTQFERVF